MIKNAMTGQLTGYCGADLHNLPTSAFSRHNQSFFRIKQNKLLYLPTQIRFLIGGERVTCHWSKLNDALGKQQLELWTRT